MILAGALLIALVAVLLLYLYRVRPVRIRLVVIHTERRESMPEELLVGAIVTVEEAYLQMSDGGERVMDPAEYILAVDGPLAGDGGVYEATGVGLVTITATLVANPAVKGTWSALIGEAAAPTPEPVAIRLVVVATQPPSE